MTQSRLLEKEKSFDDLDEADTRICRLEARVVELEDQLKDAHDYDDGHNGKCAHYGGIQGYGLGAGSPALSTPMSGPSIPMSQALVTYMGMLSAPPRVNIQEDILMEEGEMGAFLPLPQPSQPSHLMTGLIMVPQGNNWNPAPSGRPMVSMWGGFGFRPLREPPLIITSMAQLDDCIKAANRQGDMTAMARMHAYIREAQLISREEESLLQEAALTKWRIPDWVPTEGCLSAKAGNPNAPAGVNTPQIMDSPEEWVRWMWRYPWELTTCPGICHARDGISLLSIQGMQMALGRAPQGAGAQYARHTFIL